MLPGKNNQSSGEAGFTLVTTLLLFLVISLVLVSLLEMTVTSHSVVAVQEKTINAMQNAENGILIAESKLREKIGELNSRISGINPSNIKSELSAIYQEISTSNPEYDIRIENRTEIANDPTNGLYGEKITLKAIGKEGGSLKTYVKTLVLSTVADVFNYEVVTPGDLKLYGASYLQGDIYVGGDLYTHNQASFIDRQTYWVNTAYPAISGNLTLGHNLYKGNQQPKLVELTPENLNQYFSIAPGIKPATLTLPTTSIIDDALNDPRITQQPSYNQTILDYDGANVYSQSTKINSSLGFLDNTVTIHRNASLTVHGNLVITGSLKMEQNSKLSVDGDLYIGGTAVLRGDIELGKGKHLYIKGEKNSLLDTIFAFINGIFGGIFNNKSFTAVLDHLSFKGSMYVNGNVAVNRHLNANSAIYAKGDIDIYDLNNEGGGTLILLSGGEIKMYNNNLYVDSPKVIDAYLFSENNLTIYGVGSNVKINGGVFGNPIIFNATKGRTSDKEPFQETVNGQAKESTNVGGYYFDPRQLTLPPETSRLSIIYKKEMILNPPSGIPTVKQINLSEIDGRFE